MHLHGYKMEILKTFAADRLKDCTLVKCNLYGGFDIEELKVIPKGSRPMKDTFIMPAGGAVATRISTKSAATWLAHCHMELHRDDGMAFVLNVGRFSPPKDGSWLPDDFPSCDTPFLESHNHENPHCDCYIDEDAVLETALDPSYKCARPYTCMHEQSQVAMLRNNGRKNAAGLRISSDYNLPGWLISLIVICLVVISTLFFTLAMPRMLVTAELPTLVKAEAVKNDKSGRGMTLSSIEEGMKEISSLHQFKGLFFITWREYRPGVINILRVVEVCGLGMLTGLLFFNVGNNSTATGFGEKTSLLFFSTTLWSQTRMYPCIGNYFEWAIKDQHTIQLKNYNLLPVFLSRMLVVTLCESWWPFLFVFCAFPLASMFGDVRGVITICCFLVLNNSCYIAVGAVFGTLMPTVPMAMIGATLFGQTTVITAGFFTLLPKAVGWIRYISPIFYTFSGIVKTAYKISDTYKCVKGNSAVGFNHCFLEQHPAIDHYKTRGINVAAFGDPTSESVHTEVIMLLVLFSAMQLIMYVYHRIQLSRRNLSRTLHDELNDFERNDYEETSSLS